MPAKNTKVTPSDTPQMCILPNPNPMADINDNTTTACKAECSMNRLYNHSINNNYSTRALWQTKRVISGAKLYRKIEFFYTGVIKTEASPQNFACIFVKL